MPGDDAPHDADNTAGDAGDAAAWRGDGWEYLILTGVGLAGLTLSPRTRTAGADTTPDSSDTDDDAAAWRIIRVARTRGGAGVRGLLPEHEYTALRDAAFTTRAEWDAANPRRSDTLDAAPVLVANLAVVAPPRGGDVVGSDEPGEWLAAHVTRFDGDAAPGWVCDAAVTACSTPARRDQAAVSAIAAENPFAPATAIRDTAAELFGWDIPTATHVVDEVAACDELATILNADELADPFDLVDDADTPRDT